MMNRGTRPPVLHRVRDERGGALLLVLVLTMAVSVLAMGGVVMAGNARMANAADQRQSEMEAAADGGLEIGRALLNADRSRYPTSGHRAILQDAPVVDAYGAQVPGLWRTVYAGPIGDTSGQFGVFGSVLVEVGDRGRDRVIRSAGITQESFAKYAYFTNVEPSNIAFGSGDFISGPVHSNDNLKIYSTGATFQGPVSTHRTITGQRYGNFLSGYAEGVAEIPMPDVRELQELRSRAQEGGASFQSANGGNDGQARVRIEFVAVDLDGDLVANGENEGFFKIYRLKSESNVNREWLVADLPNQDPGNFDSADNLNCGYWQGTTFRRVSDMGNRDDRRDALRATTRRCYLGGSNELNGGFVADDGRGEWQRWTGAVDGQLRALVGAEADYLFPLSHALNPNFKGVIYVQGKVAVSGVLRGRVTVASSHNIIIADDMVYATDPGAGTCADMLGLFSARSVVVADNMLNTPQEVTGWLRTYEAGSGDESIHGVILALDEFAVENFGGGPTGGQACEGTPRGRGCLRLSGGIIQNQRGAVGQTNGSGYVKRYGYDPCAAENPPPYFPTTGHFRRGRVQDIDPTGFDIDRYFARLTTG